MKRTCILAIILWFTFFIGGCNETNKSKDSAFKETPFFPGDDSHQLTTYDKRCRTLAESLLDNFDAKKYVLTSPSASSQNGTVLITFSWVVSKSNLEEHSIDCYFKKTEL